MTAEPGLDPFVDALEAAIRAWRFWRKLMSPNDLNFCHPDSCELVDPYEGNPRCTCGWQTIFAAMEKLADETVGWQELNKP